MSDFTYRHYAVAKRHLLKLSRLKTNQAPFHDDSSFTRYQCLSEKLQRLDRWYIATFLLINKSRKKENLDNSVAKQNPAIKDSDRFVSDNLIIKRDYSSVRGIILYNFIFYCDIVITLLTSTSKSNYILIFLYLDIFHNSPVLFAECLRILCDSHEMSVLVISVPSCVSRSCINKKFYFCAT